MGLKEYADFANANQPCYLATVEGDQPRVRCLSMWFADETGFYFQAQTVKAMCKQLQLAITTQALIRTSASTG